MWTGKISKGCVFARRGACATAPPKRTNYRACATDLGLEHAHLDVDEKRIKRVFSRVATRVPPHRSKKDNISCVLEPTARRDACATAPPKCTNYRACATDLGLEYAHVDVDDKRIKHVFSHVAARVPPHRSNGQNIMSFAADGLEIRIVL